MTNHQISSLTPIFVLIFYLIIGESCSDKPPKPPSHENKINAIMYEAELYAKAIGLRKEMDRFTNEDTLIKKIIYEGVIQKLNSIGKIALTEDCLKKKRANSDNNKEELKQYENDSTYLSLMELKLKEIENQLTEKGDPTVLEVVIVTEKTKFLIAEMNKICPTDDGTLFK